MNRQRGSFALQFSTFVLFYITLLLAGAAAWCWLSAGTLTAHAQEQVLFLAECKADVTPEAALSLKSRLETHPAFAAVTYISPEKAASILGTDHLPEITDSEDLFQTFPPMIALHFRQDAYTSGQWQTILDTLRLDPQLEGIFAQTDLIDHLQRNLLMMSQWLTGIALVVIVLMILLMNHILKLRIFADRMEIKTMQLTGANPSYIRRPYLRRYVGIATLSAFCAILTIGYLHGTLTGFVLPDGSALNELAILAGGILGLAWLLSGIVTARIVNKYIFAQIETLF